MLQGEQGLTLASIRWTMRHPGRLVATLRLSADRCRRTGGTRN